MSEPIRVGHTLSAAEAVERLQQLAQRHDVLLTPGADAAAGTLEKGMGFLGTVRGRYRVEATQVEIVVESAPALVGDATLRRMLGEALQEAFGA